MNTTVSSHLLHRTSLALALLAALGGTLALDANAAAGYATVAQPTRIGHGDAVMGAMPMSQPVHIEVALKMRDRAGLDAFIAQAAKDQQRGIAPQLMTSEQFLAEHAPGPQQAQAVVDYLAGMGFRNVTVDANCMLVSADGTAATARNAFATTLAQVHTRDGRIAYANTDEVRIPASLSDKVLAVVGLQTVHQTQTFSHRLAGNRVDVPNQFVHDPNEWQSIYGGNTSANPVDVQIGVLTEGVLTRTNADIQNWFLLEGYPGELLTQTVVVGSTGTDTSHVEEWDLVAEDIAGIDGGQVKKLIFYDMANLTNAALTKGLNKAVTANAAKIIDVSMGGCETDAKADGAAAAQDAILAIAVAQGQTFAVAAGDLGADECPGGGASAPSWPSASQYVVAVTGTSLTTDSTTDDWISEGAWSLTGGSSSAFEPMPSWQSGFSETIGTTTYKVPGTKRAAADVAYDADPKSGALIYMGNDLVSDGGTALAASLFAGTWAHVLQLHPTIGFAGPVLYELPDSAFHDIVSGSNGNAAGTSYDLASGRGSLLIDNLVADSATLGNKPPTANFSFAATGLTVNFTDTSTDSDGTIASHSWNFGDGTTSTAANPSHAYAAAGSYSVHDNVKDNDGAFASKVKKVTVN